jgi:hypothetical protein
VTFACGLNARRAGRASDHPSPSARSRWRLQIAGPWIRLEEHWNARIPVKGQRMPGIVDPHGSMLDCPGQEVI